MDDWSSFRTTTSEQQRLRAALSGFCESQDLPEEQRAAYTAYLRKRIRPAVEMLIREDDFSKLENILQTGWLSDADRKRFLNLAADQQKWQAFRILLNRSSQDPMQENTESRKTEAAFQKEKPTKEKEALALRLFEEARKNLCWLYPELGEAILFFRHQPSDRTKAITSDGHTIYFNSDFVLRMCAENSSFLKEGYQHLLLECIRRFGKETPEPEKEKPAGLNPAAIVLLLALLGGGGVFAYLKLVKNKPKTKGNDSLDDYDYGEEDSEEWETEDEESDEPDADGGSTEEDDEDSVK